MWNITPESNKTEVGQHVIVLSTVSPVALPVFTSRFGTPVAANPGSDYAPTTPADRRLSGVAC